MDFARRQLEKYGWSDGKGLGKSENGISKAIKPKLRFDTSGIGHDAAEQFTYNWWENVYNRAAENINVKSNNGTLSIKLKSKKSVDITTKKYSFNSSKNKNKSLEYGTFLKTEKLTQNGVIKSEICESSESEESGNITVTKRTSGITALTDEELFAACGGRTAHKGARHGLKLNGKLARIEQQEILFLSSLNHTSSTKSKLKKNKKSKRNLILNQIVNMNGNTTPEQSKMSDVLNDENQPVLDHNSRATDKFLSEAGISQHKIDRRKSKKIRKRCKTCLEKSCNCSKSVFDVSGSELAEVPDKKRKKRRHDSDEISEQIDSSSTAKKKRKHGVSDYSTVILTDKQIKKKRKKEKKMKKRTEKKINKIADSLINVSLVNE